jgi:signal transduction histidine kinase
MLFRLSVLAFNENNVDEFNRLYDEMKRLEKLGVTNPISLYTEVNHQIINGDYKGSLLLVDKLPADTCAERKALIFHRLGEDEKAYSYMVRYKQISDSIERASRNRELRSMYLRMNNNRLQMEDELLKQQNTYLQYRFYIAVAIIIILILLFFAYQRYKYVRMLKRDNMMLNYGKKDAETALKNLHELSLYEKKKELMLNIPVNINKLCNRLANVTQTHCRRSVTSIFQTEFPDDFIILTNTEALEKLLMYLLNNSARFTKEGFICLKCSDSEKYVRFSITDTSPVLDHQIDEDIADNTSQYSIVNLNICQSICRLLHGNIWYDEDYTKGARFIIEIPKRTKTNNQKTTDGLWVRNKKLLQEDL